jgi:hypothetical protein
MPRINNRIAQILSSAGNRSK